MLLEGLRLRLHREGRRSLVKTCEPPRTIHATGRIAFAKAGKANAVTNMMPQPAPVARSVLCILPDLDGNMSVIFFISAVQSQVTYDHHFGNGFECWLHQIAMRGVILRRLAPDILVYRSAETRVPAD